MPEEYITPKLNSERFTCPRCQIPTFHTWYTHLAGHGIQGNSGVFADLNGHTLSICRNCSHLLFWFKEQIYFPQILEHPVPNNAMPKEVADLFQEARETYRVSAGASAALARLSLQHLLKHLGEPGENLHSEVKGLLARGVPPVVERILEAIGIQGEKSLHPGTIYLNENKEHVPALLEVINIITEVLVRGPHEAEELLKKLQPQAAPI